MGNNLLTLIVALTVILPLGSIQGLAAQQDSANAEPVSIPKLIRRLESRTFAEREQATQQLVQAGSATLRPLARNLSSASPEIVYRSRKIIQQIAKTGDESTFLKSAGVLKLVLFGTLEGHVQPMRELELQWKRGRTSAAAQKLRDAGAEIQLADEQFGLLNGNPLRASTISYLPQSRTPEKIERPKKLSKQEFRKAIDQILVGSIDQNRKLVFANETNTGQEEDLLNSIRAQQLWADRNNFINNNSFGSVGNSATIGSTWHGSDEQFAQLNSIENLTSVKLDSIEISAHRIRVLARIESLDRLEINDCIISPTNLEQITQLDSITHIGISKQDDAIELIRQISSLPKLRGIEIADCEITPSELQEVVKCQNLVQMFLTGMDISSQTLYKIGELKKLRYLSLKSCTFNVDAYQSLQRRRGDVTITTVARAFLGVRGPIEFGGEDNAECKISEVIPGSGADKAGVRIGDVITKINDHDIEVFNDLILYISQHDIGDGLTLEVIRDGQKKKLSAELGIRDETIQ